MSNTFKGKVLEVTNKKLTSSKTGKPFTVWYLEVEGVGLVNVGFKNTLKAGDMFAGVCENKYNELKLISLIDGDVVTTTTTEAPSTGGGKPAYNRGVFPIPKTSGEFSIIRQSALKAAIDTMNLTDMGTSLSKNELVDTIIEIAYIYADFSSGHREEKQVIDGLASKETK